MKSLKNTTLLKTPLSNEYVYPCWDKSLVWQNFSLLFPGKRRGMGLPCLPLLPFKAKKNPPMVLLLQRAHITLPQARRKKMIQDSLIIKSVDNRSGKINPNLHRKIERSGWKNTSHQATNISFSQKHLMMKPLSSGCRERTEDNK